MCQFSTSWDNVENYFKELTEIVIELSEMEKDGLVVLGDKSITITDKGKPFVRNICMALDLRLKRKAPKTKLFSMTV
jgi:oxygen-independent coproporphyrinogen-3 oxidase